MSSAKKELLFSVCRFDFIPRFLYHDMSNIIVSTSFSSDSAVDGATFQ